MCPKFEYTIENRERMIVSDRVAKEKKKELGRKLAEARKRHSEVENAKM